MALLAGLVVGCDVLGGGGATSDPDAAVASADGTASASVSGSAAVASAPVGNRLDASGRLDSATLARIEADSQGNLSGELLGSPPVRVTVVLSTKTAPLAHRGPVAYARVAEQIAPGLVPETIPRTFSLAELSRAAQDDTTRRLLRREARVLADGRVRAAIVRSTSTSATRVDVADLTQGGQAWSWESQLVARKPVVEGQALLSSYQALLAVDYLVGNLRRRYVRWDEAAGRLHAVDDNDVFSGQAVEGAVKDPLVRLSRFMTYSAGLMERVGALSPATLTGLLRADGDDLTTPKQIEDIMDRAQAIQKLVQTRVDQRGKERAVALP